MKATTTNGNRLILVFAFGADKHIEPNIELARIAVTEAEKDPIRNTIYTQQDININAHRPSCKVIKYIQQDSNPPSTLSLAQEAARWSQEQSIDEVCIVAAGPHIDRCVRDTQRAFEEQALDATIKQSGIINQFPYKSWFCENSKQKRTRTARSWVLRELFLRLIPFYWYKKLTT
jgi:hypothetical protein